MRRYAGDSRREGYRRARKSLSDRCGRTEMPAQRVRHHAGHRANRHGAWRV